MRAHKIGPPAGPAHAPRGIRGCDRSNLSPAQLTELPPDTTQRATVYGIVYVGDQRIDGYTVHTQILSGGTFVDGSTTGSGAGPQM